MHMHKHELFSICINNLSEKYVAIILLYTLYLLVLDTDSPSLFEPINPKEAIQFWSYTDSIILIQVLMTVLASKVFVIN